MDIQKIESQINDKKKSLAIIENDIVEKKRELDDRRGAYSRGLLQNAGKEKKSSSLDVQKRKVVEASTELEGLEGVRTLLQEEIVELEKELKLCQLFESDGKRFNKSLSECGDLVGKMTTLGERLYEDIAGFNQAVGELFRATAKAISSFSTIHGGLDKNLSLASFLDGALGACPRIG